MREWLEPVHVELALRSPAHLPDQPQHLAQTQGVQRQQDEMEDQYRMQAAEIGVGDENAVAADSDHAQRNHRFHVERQKDEDGRKISGQFRDIHGAFPSWSPGKLSCLLLSCLQVDVRWTRNIPPTVTQSPAAAPGSSAY